jgi:hypothetical protein
VLAWAEGKGVVEVVGKEGWEAEGGIKDTVGALGVRREAEEEEGGRWKGVLLSRVGEKGEPGAMAGCWAQPPWVMGGPLAVGGSSPFFPPLPKSRLLARLARLESRSPVMILA